MEQLIKDLEKAWEPYRDHNNHARRDQMMACLIDIVGTAELIKEKAIRAMS